MLSINLHNNTRKILGNAENWAHGCWEASMLPLCYAAHPLHRLNDTEIRTHDGWLGYANGSSVSTQLDHNALVINGKMKKQHFVRLQNSFWQLRCYAVCRDRLTCKVHWGLRWPQRSKKTFTVESSLFERGNLQRKEKKFNSSSWDLASECFILTMEEH